MTFSDIYDRVIWHVYGDSTPPTSVETYLQDVPEGIIANIHRRIQEEDNYWFMEEINDFSIVAATQSYALPSDFKQEVYENGLKLLLASGSYSDPLIKLRQAKSDWSFQDPTETTDYPEHYSIWENQLYLFPIPSYTTTLRMKYYKYLDRPSVFLTHDDDLTAEASELIIYLSAVELSGVLKDKVGIQYYSQKAQEQLALLKKKHLQRISAGQLEMEYWDN